MTKHIIIYGGGFSGLTTAHELLDKGFNVTLIEKDNTLGGMGRSRREVNNIPSEHSWRGYGPFYKNTFEILRKIPDKNKTVFDNLTKPIEFFVMRDDIITYKPSLSIMDSIYVGYYGLKHLVSNNRKNDYYRTKIISKLKKNLSRDGYDYLVEFIVGPGLGMEKKNVSYGHLFDIISLVSLNQEIYTHSHESTSDNKKYDHHAKDGWHVMNSPTSEAWINPWVKYLKNKGLNIILNTELVSINTQNNKIISCTIKNNNGLKKITGDDYVLALNPFSAEQIFKQSKMESLYTLHKSLNSKSISNQISFRIGFNKKINFVKNNIGFVMANSEFNITWYPQDTHWDKNVNLGANHKGKIKSLWSGTLIDSESIGKLYKKKATDMTKNELIEEIIHQILKSKSLQKNIFDNNGFYLNKTDITYKEIWYEWEFNKGKLKQKNIKWVNTMYNEQYRPKQTTIYNNMYIAGSHTKTSINIWSMESAVESGKIVANHILKKYKLHPSILFTHKKPSYILFFQYIDDMYYCMNLPNIVDIIIIMIIVYLLYISYSFKTNH